MNFEVIASSPPGFPGAKVAEAAARGGFIGSVALEHGHPEAVDSALRPLVASGVEFTVSLPGAGSKHLERLGPAFGRGLRRVILTEPEVDHPEQLERTVRLFRERGLEIFAQAVSIEGAVAAERCGVDALIVKGNEGGGLVTEETTFVLLQWILPRVTLPVYARGGVGPRTAAACLAAGAFGVMLDWQLGLCEESELPEDVQKRLTRMDGSETTILGQDLPLSYRVSTRPSEAYVDLKERAERGELSQGDPAALRAFKEEVERRAAARELLLIGQDGAFARQLADRYRSVGGICRAIRREACRQVRVAERLNALGEGAPLASSHGTRYPIVQGPMTRVSDRAEFVRAVSHGGGLPFLALALMRAGDVAALLRETRDRLGDRPWGVGILGFVPKELRDEQLAEVRTYRPAFMLIAGGRPDQAKALEAEGIRTYLHVPSPELLRTFLKDGARRIVLEGRECGGHVGPRSSFVLWESAIEVILRHLAETSEPGEGYHVLFAGGLHDALSTAMVAALAAPLSERGVKIGVLLGTAYLFTREAVESGAIAEGFQREAIACSRTRLLESGVGHATRCADTSFGRQFAVEKRRLLSESRPAEEIREKLETLNLGRLRIASKGVARGESEPGAAPVYVRVDEGAQRRDGLYMIGQVAALRDRVCTIAELHQQVAGSAAILAARAASEARKAPGIAIVGISCTLPKAGNKRTFWQNVQEKVNAIEEVPKERWDVELYFDGNRRTRDKIYSRWGGFLEDLLFDPLRYGMPPATIPSVEPLQLVTLEMVREALADAGYLDRRFDRERTAVIIGTGGGVGELGMGYGFRSMIPHYIDAAGAGPEGAQKLIENLDTRLPEWTEDSFAGLLLNVTAGRVANRFDLGGMNCIVDAACATSLAALRLAALELQTRSSDMVIVGGADMMQSPFAYLSFSKTQALSPTGQCRTFDETADGIVISEGVGVCVLKRLEDAERDGDRIYAVLKSVGASSDGKDKGLTAPRPAGQIRALARAYESAGIPPDTVGLIEAHGTGTVVGDRSEVESLSTFFGGAGALVKSCALGSVKSMIGHTKCTAGFAGLIKTAMALHHRVLPPTIGVTQPNSKANFESSPFYLNTEPRPWLQRSDGAPRRAGVSAFGFGGTNFHAVLEEYRPVDDSWTEKGGVERWPAELFLWRGESAQKLAESIGRLQSALAEGAEPRLCDLASAVHWEEGRSPHGHCLAVVAESLEDLKGKLDRARKALESGAARLDDPRGIYYAAASGGPVAFLFPGQGSQRTDMLCRLALAFPQVQDVFERADRALGGRLGKPLSHFVFPPPAFTPLESAASEEALKQTNVAQPALGAADMAVYRLLVDLGVRPDFVGGHSYGEFVALAAAGVLSFEDLISLSEARGRFILEAIHEESGSMAAVAAGESAVAATLEGVDGVCIANLNSPAQTVISGTRAGLDEALRRIAHAGLAAQPIPVPCAFHSSLMDAAREPLGRELENIDLHPPRVPVFSNTTGTPHGDDPRHIRNRMREHLTRPVRFVDEIRAMHEAGARIFIEVGPGKVLTGLTERILEGVPHRAIAIDAPPRDGLVQFVHALGCLAVEGVRFMASRLFEGRVEHKLPLSDLLRQSKPTPPPPTAWAITAGRAVPVKEYQEGAHRRPSRRGGIAIHEVGERTQRHTPPPSTSPAENGGSLPRAGGSAEFGALLPQPPNLGALPLQPATLAATHAVAESMNAHHRLMSKFLETHRSLMLAYLQGRAAPGTEAFETAATPLARTEPSGPDRVLNFPVPAVVTSLGRDAIVERLVALVSERTGYPPDILDPNLDLEADLGVDSIKRIEILSALKESALPDDVVDGAMEELASCRTLFEIADCLTAKFPASATGPNHAPTPAPPPAPALPTQALAERPARLVLRAVEHAAHFDLDRLRSHGLVVMTDDGRGVAASLVKQLERFGVQSHTIPSHLEDERSLSELIAGARRAHGRATALVHLRPLVSTNASDADALEPRGFERRLDGELKELLQLARMLESDLRECRRGAVLTATMMGGAFGVGAERQTRWQPASGGVCGFTKALAREWQDVSCRAVDFEADAPPERIAEALLQELGTEDGRNEIGHRNGRRLTLDCVRSSLESGPSKIVLDSESVVLITGGARGITAEIARELANRFQPRLILLGRSPLPPEREASETAMLSEDRDIKRALADKLKRAGGQATPGAVEAEFRVVRRQREMRANLDAMRRAGATVDYFSVDVTDGAAFGVLIDGIYERFGRLDAVVHGAGIIEDKLLRDKSLESFDRVIRPKVAGALTLASKIRRESLTFLAFFSSVTARYGNRGQLDYAAASETLNKLAVWLNSRWAGRVVALNWGPWKSATGMVSEELARQFALSGVQMVEPEAGRRAFVEELLWGEKDEPEVVLGGPLSPVGPPPLAEPDPPAPAALDSFPLLAGAELTRRNGSLEVVLDSGPERDVYLLDHHLDGVPVLPMAMVLELAAETAAVSRPDQRLDRVRSLQVLKGVSYNGGRSRKLRVEISTSASTANGSILDFRVRSVDSPSQLHYRAQLELKREAEPALLPAPLTLTKPRPLPLPLAEAYGRWLFHGPLFAGITSVEALGENGATARLRPSSPHRFFHPPSAGRWRIDPVVVDSAFQLVILWARTYLDQTPLPSKLGCFHFYRPFSDRPEEELRVEAEIRHRAPSPSLRIDFRFYDGAGGLVSRIEEMDVTLSSALNRLASRR